MTVKGRLDGGGLKIVWGGGGLGMDGVGVVYGIWVLLV